MKSFGKKVRNLVLYAVSYAAYYWNQCRKKYLRPQIKKLPQDGTLKFTNKQTRDGTL